MTRLADLDPSEEPLPRPTGARPSMWGAGVGTARTLSPPDYGPAALFARRPLPADEPTG
ncbi:MULTISPECIES: hypothetical protein [Streptomyces]|uniref:hypothetical protein n=1 Tax=Streptomyces TaxID=1883 RepID=UPI0013163B02|nr:MULTISPECIES: hypothetical protein [Streptomyces]QGZ52510.1 hypothetical protein GPZ77_33075 [Streptomyces sp. QHH-9511]GGT84369.1 hypothetical protein GCM10010272_31200 [Streptomyces lateritius]